MAKRQIQNLSPDARKELDIFKSQYIPWQYHQQFEDELAKNGTLSKDFFDKANFNSNDRNMVSGLLQNITGGKPTMRDYTASELAQQTNPTVNEANLTDQELQDRKSAFQDLGQTGGSVTDPAAIGRALEKKLEAFGIPGTQDNEILRKYLTLFIVKNQRLPDVGEAQNFGLFNGIEKKSLLENFLNDQDNKNSIDALVKQQTTAPNTSTDVSRISDILSSRKTQSTNEQSLQDYINSLPDALSSGRNQYIQALQSQGQQQFRDVLAPQALQSLNARGALFSGDVGDVLGSTVGNIQGNIENMQSQLTAQDNQFYFNAAYQNALRQQLVGQTNYQQFLSGERNRVLQTQQNQFQTSQQQLNYQNQNDNMMRQYQNQLIQQQKQYQMQQDYANSQRRAGLIGGIGQTVGGIAGSYFGPAGTMAGSYLGGQVGGMFGSSQGGYGMSNYPLIPQAGGRQ